MKLKDKLAMQVPSSALRQDVKDEKLEEETKLSVIEDMATALAIAQAFNLL